MKIEKWHSEDETSFTIKTSSFFVFKKYWEELSKIFEDFCANFKPFYSSIVLPNQPHRISLATAVQHNEKTTTAVVKMSELSTKWPGKYLLNVTVHGFSKALKLGEWTFVTIFFRILLNFVKNILFCVLHGGLLVPLFTT